MAKNYHYSNDGVLGYNGKDKIKIPIDQAGKMSTETRHIFLVILNASELKTQDDSIQGNRLATAIDEAEGKDEIVIGEGVYDWLKKKMDAVNRDGYQVCPMLFRVNGEIVYEFVKDGYKKPQESKPKKKGKEGPDAEAAEESREPQPEA